MAGGLLKIKGQLNEAGTVAVNGQPAIVSAANLFEGHAQVGAGTTAFTITAADLTGNATTQQYEVDTAGAGKGFTFDANGNLTADGTRTFEWDARNQLVAASTAENRVEFAYDYFGRRTTRVHQSDGGVPLVESLIWCGRELCERRSSGDPGLTALFWRGIKSSAETRLFVHDRLGSTYVVTTPTAVLAETVDYDPFGRPSSDRPVGSYTGYPYDESAGVYLALYRAFDPALGRWLSSDPAKNVDGPNWYAYVKNNPLRFFDPYGLQSISAGPSCKPCNAYLHRDAFLACFLTTIQDPNVWEVLTGCVGMGLLHPIVAGACGALTGWYTKNECKKCATYCDEVGPPPNCPPNYGSSLGPAAPPGPQAPPRR